MRRKVLPLLKDDKKKDDKLPEILDTPRIAEILGLAVKVSVMVVIKTHN